MSGTSTNVHLCMVGPLEHLMSRLCLLCCQAVSKWTVEWRLGSSVCGTPQQLGGTYIEAPEAQSVPMVAYATIEAKNSILHCSSLWQCVPINGLVSHH